MYVVAGHYRESLVTVDRGLVDAVLAMVVKVTKARLPGLPCRSRGKGSETSTGAIAKDDICAASTKLRHVTEHAPARQERFRRPKFQLSDKD